MPDDTDESVEITADIFSAPSPADVSRDYRDMVNSVILGPVDSLVRPATATTSGDSGVEKELEDVTVPAIHPTYHGGTKQIQGDVRFHGDQIEKPPIDIRVFAAAPERSTRLLRCIHTYARNTVGMGWEIKAVEATNKDTPDEERTLIEEERRLVEPLFKRPNPKDYTFTRLMFKVKLDVEATGNGYIEIVRNQDGRLDPLGEIVEMWRVPSLDCRVLLEGLGFVQIKSYKKVYFKNFGDPRQMHKDTGEFHTQFDEQAEPGELKIVPVPGKAAIPLHERANEILHFTIPCLRNDFYGMPRYVAASAAVAGNWLLSGRSVNFFSNDAVPRLIITVSGGKLTSESVDTIKDLLNATAKGPKNFGRVIVLQAEPKKAGMMSEHYKTEIDVKPLLVGVSEEMSFGGYRQRNDEEIREAFNIGKAFFTCLTGDTVIPLLDGTYPTIQELAERRADDEFWVHSYDRKTGKIVPGMAYAPRPTRKQAPVFTVTLDNGETVRATGNHPFLLRTGRYRAAEDLRPGDSLMSKSAVAQAAGSGNHKVVSVEPAGCADVYDLSVRGYRNFALGAGVFVHNSDDVNRANADASRKITNEQEFEPDRIDMEEFINGTLVESFQVRKVGFFFKRLKLVDEDERGNIDARYGSMAALTVNEIRTRAGLPPFPKDYTFADKPWPVALLEMQLGVKDLVDYPDDGKGEEAGTQIPKPPVVFEEDGPGSAPPSGFKFPSFLQES